MIICMMNAVFTRENFQRLRHCLHRCTFCPSSLGGFQPNGYKKLRQCKISSKPIHIETKRKFKKYTADTASLWKWVFFFVLVSRAYSNITLSSINPKPPQRSSPWQWWNWKYNENSTWLLPKMENIIQFSKFDCICDWKPKHFWLTWIDSRHKSWRSCWRRWCRTWKWSWTT